MIKKTTQTLKDNPVLFAWFLIPFVYQVINIYLVNQGILSPARFADALRNIGTVGWNAGALEYVTWLIETLYFVGWTMLLYPPLIYLVYKTADNKPIDGWYMDGLKHGWWRLIVFMVMAIVGIMIVVLLLSGVSWLLGMISFVFEVILIPIQMIVMFIFFVSVLVYMQTGMITVIAEKDFRKSFVTAFKVGRKHYFRILLVCLLLMIPFIMTSIGIRGGQQELSDTMYLLVSFLGCFISPIVSTFVMHCYIDTRDKEIEKKALMEQAAVTNEK